WQSAPFSDKRQRWLRASSRTHPLVAGNGGAFRRAWSRGAITRNALHARGVASRSVADLLISRVAPGVAAVRSVDPFDTLEIYRIDRARWQHTPERPGVYLLYGVTADGKLTVYIGMSATNMRNRIRSHHVSP